jgi:ubiquinone/menaquinone biosynthesis C-methylase UbiE
MVITFPVPPRRTQDSRAPGWSDPELRLSAITDMSPVLDDLSLKFAMWAGQTGKACLDVGCGAGIAAVAALARGGRIVAADPDPALLQQLLARVPVQQYARLAVRTAALPELDFKQCGFAGVHVARVLHVLDGRAIRLSLAKFFRWLYPHGKLFVSALTPLGSFWHRFQPEFIRRATAGSEWPGYIEDLSQYHFTARKGVPCHLLDENLLSREMQTAGFVIESTLRYSLPWEPEQICCSVIARCAP